MPEVISLEELRRGPFASLFEGDSHGGAAASIFITAHPTGRGPGLHVHPYPEVFVVLEGRAAFTVGDERIDVDAGNVVVVPAETPHGFVGGGVGVLRIVSVHPSGHVVQTWLDEE